MRRFIQIGDDGDVVSIAVGVVVEVGRLEAVPAQVRVVGQEELQ